MRHSGRRAAAIFAVAFLSLGIMGMGGFGGGRETEAPLTDFGAVFVDLDATRIEAMRVTAGGGTSLEGDLGRGRLRVPFDNISRITFKPSGGDRERLLAEVTLREGEPLTLTVRSSTTFYGRVPSGAFQIRARDLKSVEFVR